MRRLRPQTSYWVLGTELSSFSRPSRNSPVFICIHSLMIQLLKIKWSCMQTRTGAHVSTVQWSTDESIGSHEITVVSFRNNVAYFGQKLRPPLQQLFSSCGTIGTRWLRMRVVVGRQPLAEKHRPLNDHEARSLLKSSDANVLVLNIRWPVNLRRPPARTLQYTWQCMTARHITWQAVTRRPIRERHSLWHSVNRCHRRSFVFELMITDHCQL